MLLSIWVLTYNRLPYLKLLLDSIFKSQILENENVELIVINNASTDETQQYLDKLDIQKNIKIFTRDFNLRGSGVVQDFLNLSSGKWIFSVGDDDICYSETLKKIPKILDSLNSLEVSLIPFAASTVDEEGAQTPIIYSPPIDTEQVDLLAKLINRSIYWLPATIFNRNLLSSERPTTITVFDWWLWLEGVICGELLKS